MRGLASGSVPRAHPRRTEVELFADSTKFSGPTVRTTFVKAPTWDVAGYALGDLTTGRVTFSAGARYDYVRIPVPQSA